MLVARNRNISGSFFRNEYLAEIDPFGRLLFAGLPTIADREGRLEDRPRRIHADLFPYDHGLDIDALLNELAIRKFIVRYQVDGTSYIQIIKFLKHQRPHPREADSVIPPPPGGGHGHAPDAVNDGEGNAKDMPRTDQGNAKDMPRTVLSRRDLLDPGSSWNNILSGSPPDDARVEDKKPMNGTPRELWTQAEVVLEFLSRKSGRQYRAREGPKGKASKNLELVHARLASGVTVQECKAVIARKCREWKDKPDMRKYMRPETLFNRTKFESYLGECREMIDDDEVRED
jgi:uncharacterized phage protein (TIGR02220 family)